MKWIESLLSGSRYLVMLGVGGTLLAALTVYIGSAVVAIDITIDFVAVGSTTSGSVKKLAVDYMRVVDLFFIATAFQIISIGMYRLFIRSDFSVPGPMAVSSFSGLKRTLASIVAVVLLILFLDYVVTNGPTDLLLELGVAIAVVIVAAGWTMGRMGEDH